MFRFLLKFLFIYLPGVFLAVLLVTTAVAWQQKLLTSQTLAELAELNRSQGFLTTLTVIRMEVFGTGDQATDPSYGRKLVDGRGYSPWVVRSNLDNRPRILNFALRPGLWAAYDTDSASLYQVWSGEVLWQGAHYDYRHGPQPESAGEWYIQYNEPHQWYLQLEGQPAQEAEIHFLGYEYGPGRLTAALRYQLQVAGLHVRLLEYPDIDSETGEFLRQFALEAAPTSVSVHLDVGDGPQQIDGTIRLPLQETTAIVNGEYQRKLNVEDSALARGQSVIEGSDCLSCHAEQHQVAGPSWARIAGRYRGYVQEETLKTLTDRVIRGSSGQWGPMMMSAHPDLTRDQVRDALSYILTRADSAIEAEIPLNDAGEPYASTREFDVGVPLDKLHPSFNVDSLLLEGFEPKVGGMDFRADGKLLVSSWDADGAVFLVDPDTSAADRVQRIAEGLHEPLGLSVVDNRIFVMQKQELTELIDHDGDNIIDEYRLHASGWPVTSNFHSFAFGMVHKEDYLYVLLSVCVLPGGASCSDQQPTQGKLLKVSVDTGEWQILASGFRTPNGIGIGPHGQLFVTDNQGDWLPANKLVHVEEGAFYGSRVVADPGVLEKDEKPPVVWLPQDEIANSPTQPLVMEEGPYFGQLLYGDVTHGGIKRVYLDEVNGELQGALFRFSGGFHGGVNRLLRGPHGEIYVGEIGSRPNWSQIGKAWYGLERLSFLGDRTFEILRVMAEPNGFSLEFTQPVDTASAELAAETLVKQWFYYPTEQYGGPKYDEQVLTVKEWAWSVDRRQLRLVIPDLKPGYVIYLRLSDGMLSETGDSLWTYESWYTLNSIPTQEAGDRAPYAESEIDGDWTALFNGRDLSGWRNYGRDDARGWFVEEGVLAFRPSRFPMLSMIKSAVFGGGSGDLIYGREKFRDFELSLDWKISEGGNSGIFFLVADEQHKMPWETGPEIQVLDNDGHADGAIETHRAGDLYDLIAADPVTVKPPGEWNQVLIRVQDNQIENWLNGVKVLEVERGGERWNQLVAASKFNEMPDFGRASEGYIVLQDHGDPVWYRNIRLRRLPSMSQTLPSMSQSPPSMSHR